MFAGTFTALITPFRNGEVDRDAFKALIDQQAAAGITGIVPVGTTGESATLTNKEHLEVIRLAVEFNAGRMIVLAGTGANSTSEAIELTKAAADMGVDATLQVTPYYNRPSQEGLYQHYKAIASATNLPVMLYSVPGRAAVEIAPNTAARLANDCPTIIALKEAGGRPERITELKAVVPDSLQLLSGDDPQTYEFMKRGAVGLVSVAANLVPEAVVSLVKALGDEDYDAALAIHEKYFPLFSDIMGLDTNPVPIKTAVSLTGLCTDELRLPLVNLSDENLSKLKTILADFDLI